jgi:hypothetical protein
VIAQEKIRVGISVEVKPSSLPPPTGGVSDVPSSGFIDEGAVGLLNPELLVLELAPMVHAMGAIQVRPTVLVWVPPLAVMAIAYSEVDGEIFYKCAADIPVKPEWLYPLPIKKKVWIAITIVVADRSLQ